MTTFTASAARAIEDERERAMALDDLDASPIFVLAEDEPTEADVLDNLAHQWWALSGEGEEGTMLNTNTDRERIEWALCD